MFSRSHSGGVKRELSEDKEDHSSSFFIPADGIDLEVLAFYLKYIFDPTAELRFEKNRDDVSGYRIISKKTMKLQDIRAVIEDSQAYRKEKKQHKDNSERFADTKTASKRRQIGRLEEEKPTSSRRMSSQQGSQTLNSMNNASDRQATGQNQASDLRSPSSHQNSAYLQSRETHNLTSGNIMDVQRSGESTSSIRGSTSSATATHSSTHVSSSRYSSYSTYPQDQYYRASQVSQEVRLPSSGGGGGNGGGGSGNGGGGSGGGTQPSTSGTHGFPTQYYTSGGG